MAKGENIFQLRRYVQIGTAAEFSERYASFPFSFLLDFNSLYQTILILSRFIKFVYCNITQKKYT